MSNDISEQRLIHDVFISFRGGDTRKKFTSHLLGALKRHCFDIFHDSMLPRGQDIRSKLMKAIEESRISAVVFSANYADSDWCLDELVKIVDCRKLNQQIILPIFLDVEPSDVRRQQGSYKKAFADHEANFDQERVQKWRKALRKVGKLSGLHLQNDENGDEEMFIEKVVKEVEKKSNRPNLHVADHPVGIESRVKELVSLLSLDSNDVRIVAVWGHGGIGKTTIAKATYGCIASKFETHGFIADVRNIFRQSNGKVKLQNKLISQLTQNNNSEKVIDDYHRGFVKIKKMISYQKVLLVIDDVDNVVQLKTLAIDRKFFCTGSRIIVTTRDKACLSLLQVSATYEPSQLGKSESLELFTRHAFGEDHPKEGYEKISEEVASCAAGLPLVLEVWGAHLRYFDSVELWRSALNKLRKIPHADVQEKLKISYDSLDDRQKKLFLDIACFLVGMDKDLVVKVSHDESLVTFSESEIKILVGRCLVRIHGNEVSMHDAIQAMGQEIVRQESKDEPGKRSRLWDHMHVPDVLRDCSGTELVESISLNSSELEKEAIAHVEALQKMSNLRLIRLNNVRLLGTFPEGDMHPSPFRKLKYMEWCQFPLRHINMDMGNVVAIDLQYSKLEILWEGIKILKDLRFLNVSHSSFLLNTPDFSGLTNLEEIYFCDCPNLEELHCSVGCLHKLIVLELRNCIRLSKFPSKSIRELRSLEKLDLSGCHNIGDDVNIRHLMSSLKDCHITQLSLAECNILKVPGDVTSLLSLQKLDLSGNKFCYLPDSLDNLRHLEAITLSNCDRLELMPDLPRNLQSITAQNCTGLKNLPSNMSELKSLTTVLLDGSSKLDSGCLLKLTRASNLENLSMRSCNLSFVPSEIERLMLLKILNLSGNVFSNLPDSFSSLRNLKNLYLNDSAQLNSFPPLPLELLQLKATNCRSLQMMPFIPTKSVDFSHCPESLCKIYAYEFRGNVLQRYKELPDTGLSICLSGTTVPEWCQYQSTGRFLSFVAPLYTNRKIRGFISGVIVHQCDENNSCSFNAKVLNETTGISYDFGHCFYSDFGTLRLMFNRLDDSTLVVEGGDSVVVEFYLNYTHLPSGKVEKCGVCLIYENPESNIQQVTEYTNV